MLLFSPCKRCPCPCSDEVLRFCEEVLAGIILHRPPSLWFAWVRSGCAGEHVYGGVPSPPPPPPPPMVWSGRVGGGGGAEHVTIYIDIYIYIYIFIYLYVCVCVCVYLHVVHKWQFVHTYRQTDRQTGRQADRQTGRQADRQTDRHYTHTRIQNIRAYKTYILTCLTRTNPK